MAVSNKALNDALREKYLELISKTMTEAGEEVLRVGSNEICFPCVDSAGNDKYIILTVKVPIGSRDGDAYDGYSMAEDYAMKVREKAEKAEKAKADKEKKIAKDKAMREQRAKAKAEREAKGEG